MMVIGETFAWAHLGKTGGDATHSFFSCLNIKLENTSKKHDAFYERKIDPEKTLLTLNIRRLPSWGLSHMMQWQGHNCPVSTVKKETLKDFGKNYPVPAETLKDFGNGGLGDHVLITFWPEKIKFWMRMESLRSDFIKFVQTHVKTLTDEEMARIKRTITKSSINYNHNLAEWYTKEELKKMYELSPIWRSIEESVYEISVDEYIDSIFQSNKDWRANPVN